MGPHHCLDARTHTLTHEHMYTYVRQPKHTGRAWSYLWQHHAHSLKQRLKPKWLLKAHTQKHPPRHRELMHRLRSTQHPSYDILPCLQPGC